MSCLSVLFTIATMDPWNTQLIALCLTSFFSSCFLQYNDNTGNPYSDVFWLAALVQSIGEFEFGQQVCGLLLRLILKITCTNHFSVLSLSKQQLLNLKFRDLVVDKRLCKMFDFKLWNIHLCKPCKHCCSGVHILWTVNLYLQLKWISLPLS